MNHLIGPLGNVLTSTPAPTNVTMSTFLAGSSGVTATWTASVGATSYTVDFYSNTSPSTTGGTLFQTLSVATTTATSTNILGGARYYYAIVRAVNSSGLTSSAVTSSSITTVFTSVTGLFVWLDSQDPTSYTLSGSTLTSPGWIDKVTSLAFRPKNGGASNVVTSSTNYPTISNSGTISSGIYFPNTSSTQSSSSVGIQANLSSAPLIFPTQNMTFCILITNTANNNTGFRCCLQASKSSIVSRPNFTVSFHTNATEGFSVNQDNDGSAWGRALTTNQPAHTISKQILIGTSSSSSTTLFQNGTSIVLNTTTYTSTYANYNIYNLGIAVNNNGARCWEGTVHEIMIFNKALTNAERIRVEGYLAWKCGINTSLPSDHPYRNNAFAVIMGTYTTGDTSISVSWDPVSGATSYTVKFYSNSTATTSGGTLVETNTNTDVSTTSRTSTIALVANTYYYASVTTINYGGTSSEQVSSSTIQTAAAAAAALTGTVTTFAGSGTPAFVNGIGTNASFNRPVSLAVATDGTLYVTDIGNNCIRKITTGAVVSTFAGRGGQFGYADGIGTNAAFASPNGITMSTDGTLYVSENNVNNNHRIRKITTGGVVSTFAGSGSAAFADGIGTNASFSYPAGMAMATDGTIYVADYANNRIRKITTGGVVSTFAGSGSAAFADGIGTNASFKNPNGVAVATDGTIYVADYANNRIRKITTGGVVSTFAGSGSAAFADGIGTNASFSYPAGMAMATDGTIYVADYANNRIRKITTGGVVSTFAGSGTAAFADGIGTNASFFRLTSLAIATDGTMYVADYENHRIRKIT
jgi:serine/threonine-protein kinase